jgi:flagellar hook assembly protein FlgD
MTATPTPFVSSTRFDYQLPADSRVQLRIYDITGALVRSLVDGEMPRGRHPVYWDGRDESGSRVASGMYYVQLLANGEQKRQKVVALR